MYLRASKKSDKMNKIYLGNANTTKTNDTIAGTNALRKIIKTIEKNQYKRNKKMTFQLPQLQYEYNALEPYIDEKTMIVHHTKHHQAYTDKFNAALQKHPELFKKTPEDIIANVKSIPEDIQEAVRNNGGGYVNHALFWKILSVKSTITEELKKIIEENFESFENFKELFENAATTQFGSGWAWLSVDKKGKLFITKTSNQDSPLTEGLTPILCLDVWEHAYYLKYQNKRGEYVKEFWNVVNWDVVLELYKTAVQ